jgi:endoglucanase
VEGPLRTAFAIVAALCSLAAAASAAVPPLRARGTTLVDPAGHVVQLRGVNLGGWLLMEPWMCPVDSTGTIKDDFTARQTLADRFGPATADRLVDAYEDAWITGHDLDNVRSLGLNAVRVPFWYRTVETEAGDWRPDAFRRLDWVVTEAGRRGLYVILDLHGVPGGQNKADNSGRVREHPTFWTDADAQRRAADIWHRVAEHFKGNATVAAYDLLNEPIASPSRDALWAVDDQLYRAVRSADADHVVSVEACRGDWSLDELPPPTRFGWRNVLYQTHSYEWAWNDLAKQKGAVARQVAMYHDHAAWDVPGYVGEFNPMAQPAAWADAICSFDAAGLSWTTWTYKSSHGSGSDSWGAYNPRSPRPPVPDLAHNSADDIAAKWSRWTTATAFAANPMVTAALSTPTADAGWTAGVDLSALPALEAAGAVYRDSGDRSGDAVAILQRHGANLVRLRLFVNPSHDFNATIGATQDLPTTVTTARRARAAGLRVLLDLHDADTWADPAHQPTPAAWATLSPGDLRQRVESYTADVVRQVGPDWVAVGNEVTNGMLWPTGKLDKTDASWDRFADLLSAGVRGVRSAAPGAKVMVHVSGGGRAGLPAWFFDHLDRHHVDYDLVGVSFYPTWGDDIDALRQNLADLAGRGKDVVVAEVGYPSRGRLTTPQCRWPATPAGQSACLSAVTAAVRAAPGGHGKGVIWWYPEAIPVRGVNVWEGGRLGLFDEHGTVLPAADGLRPSN